MKMKISFSFLLTKIIESKNGFRELDSKSETIRTFNYYLVLISDTYCWIHTTFSIENAWKKRVGDEVPYPGVDKYTPNERRVYHAYYQWVCFVLFFQALLFYVPRYFWKAVEGGRLKNLILGLNSPVCNEETKNTNRALLVEYLYKNINNHNTLFIMYTIAEVLNLLNVILQMMIMDRFLGGEFTSYGWDVINFSEWDWSVRYDPMVSIALPLCLSLIINGFLND